MKNICLSHKRLLDYALAVKRWVAVTGSSGMGKSQLACAIYEARGASATIWIDLRGQATTFERHLVEQMLRAHEVFGGTVGLRMAYLQGIVTEREVFAHIVALTGDHFLMVLDDLPDITVHERAHATITAIADSLIRSGGHILSTGQHALPNRLLDVLGVHGHEIVIPAMDAADIRGIMGAASAPETSMNSRFIDFLKAYTSGHPALVSAAIGWLARNAWAYDDTSFDQLLRGVPLHAVRDEARQTVRRLISDEKTRELLDRLSLVGTPFNLPTVTVVGGVTPPIEHPEERVHDLLGPWIEVEDDSRYDVSPLLRDVGKAYLAADMRRDVHRAIARLYVRPGWTLSASDAFPVCLHLYNGEEWEMLTLTLMTLLQSIETKEHARYFTWVAHYFAPGTQWPPEIRTGIRIAIRALQVRLLHRAGERLDRHETDLEALIESAGTDSADQMAVGLARFYAGALREDLPAGIVAQHAVEAFRAFRRSGAAASFALPPEVMFWFSLGTIASTDDVRSIVAVLRDLTPSERKQILANPMSTEMYAYFADSCESFTADNSPSAATWREILVLLGEIAALGEGDGCPALSVAARRTTASILADHLHSVDDALVELDAATLTDDFTGFIIAWTRGRILLAHRGAGEALSEFERALALPTYAPKAYYRHDAMTHAMDAAARLDRWDDARRFCLMAIQDARARSGNLFEKLELFGELAWIHWQRGARRQAFAAMHRMVRQLLTVQDTGSARYNEVVWKVGHVLGWITAIVSLGHPPDATSDGEVYTAPFTGFLFRRNPHLAEMQRHVGLEAMLWQLGKFAESVGELQTARVSFLQSAQMARNEGRERFASEADWQRSAVEAFLGNYTEALEAIMSGMRSLAMIARTRSAVDIMDQGDLSDALNQLPLEIRQNVERESVFVGVFWPTLTRLLASDRASAATELDTLDRAIGALSGTLTPQDYWRRMVSYMRLVFDDSAHAASTQALLNDGHNVDTYEHTMLAIALACSHDVMPIDALTVQADVLYRMSGVSTEAFTQASYAQWLVRYWLTKVAQQGFRFSAPAQVLRSLEELSGQPPTLAVAVQTLRAIALALRARFPTEMQDRLQRMIDGRPIP